MAEETRKHRNWKEVGQLIIGLVVLAAMVLTVVYGVSITDCQTKFNVAYAAALRERSSIADRWRDDQIVYLRVVADPQSTPTDRHDALTAYLGSLQVSADQRDATPLPEDPRCR